LTRIAHFTDASIGGVNGIASSIRLLIETLTPRGHDCTVISAGRAANSPGDGDVIWVPSMPTGMGDFRFAFFPIRSMRDRVRAWKPDIAHVHTPGPLGAAGLTVARQLDIPAVYTYHTDLHGYSKHYRIPTPAIRAGIAVYARHLRRATTRRPVGKYEVIEAGNARVFEAADVIIAPTTSALRRCRMAAFADKVRVIATPANLAPAGTIDSGTIDSGTIDSGAAEFRARFGIAEELAVVLFVGRLSDEKGIRLLLDAFTLVRAYAPATTLLLVGPQSRRLGLERLLDRANLTAHTVVTGTLRGAEVQAAYHASTVFAFPSSTDTQGIVLHEAALAGLPIVMADRLLHGGHPLTDAMRVTDATPAAFAAGIFTLLLARDSARLLGRRARVIAKELTPDRFANETLQAYHDAYRIFGGDRAAR
jgi:glycosyltransferase involved in cell wall biosynthesis